MGHRREDGHEHTLPELFSTAQWVELAGRMGLTDRQRTTAELMCRGLTNREIALRLGISSNTVRMHVRDLFRRLSVRDRVGVVVRLVLIERRLEGDDPGP